MKFLIINKIICIKLKVNSLFIFFLLLMFFSSCKKEYFDIDEKEKIIFLFNSYNIGDTFRMTRNTQSQIDTLTYTIVQKDINYTKRYKSLNKYDQYYILAFTCDKTDSLQIYNSGGVYFTRDETVLFFNEFSVNTLISENDTITVNGAFYDNLYKLTNDNNNVFALTSEKFGIVKIWAGSLSYKRLP